MADPFLSLEVRPASLPNRDLLCVWPEFDQERKVNYAIEFVSDDAERAFPLRLTSRRALARDPALLLGCP
jgi:hypothetical protein